MGLDIDFTPRTIERFKDALADAFRSIDQLDGVYYPLLRTPSGRKNLAEVVSDRLDLGAIRNRIVQDAEARGYGLELLAAALIENPTGPALLEFAATVPLVMAPVTRDAARTEALHDLLLSAYGANRLWQIERLARMVIALDPKALPADSGFEGMFLPVGFQDPSAWRTALAHRERQVCRIVSLDEAPAGTGFLVGPDLVLTNSHVVYDLTNRPKAFFPERFECQFDVSEDNAVGDSIPLASNPLVAQSPASELDYALLRLARPVGGERGWVDLTAPEDAHPGEAVFVLQHPGGKRLRLAAGAVVTDPGAAPTELAYLAPTAPGASGSPCFNLSWRPVALHHYGASANNRGIRVSALLPQIGSALNTP